MAPGRRAGWKAGSFSFVLVLVRNQTRRLSMGIQEGWEGGESHRNAGGVSNAACSRCLLSERPQNPENQTRGDSGNGSLLKLLISSKYLLSALLMEFGEQLRHSGVRPDVRWAPREANREAHRLANGDTTGFDPSLRLRVLPPVGGWFTLDDALLVLKQRTRSSATEQNLGGSDR